MIFDNAGTKLINHDVLSDKAFIDTISAYKNASEYIEMLLRFESGDGIAHKDYILEMQNTTRENYPTLLMAFIADINKSTALITKAIVGLYTNEATRQILLSEMYIIDHSVQIDEKGILVSMSAENAFKSYFESVKPYVETLYQYFLNRSWVNGLNMDELKDMKMHIERRHKAYMAEEPSYQAVDHPKYFSYGLREPLKKIRKGLENSGTDICAAVDYFLSEEFEDPMDPVYYSCNLYDFKLTPNKSAVYPIGTINEEIFEIVGKGACSVTKKSHTLHTKWEPDYSIEFYIKKHLIEKSTKKPFAQFIGAARDYLARDNFALTQDKNWNEDHPFIAESMIVLEFEKKIDEVREAYDLCIIALRKISNRGMFLGVDEWKEEIRLIGGKNVPLPSSATSATSSCTPDEYLEATNEWARLKTDTLVSHYSDNKRFERAKQEELFIRSSIENILSYFYHDDVSDNAGAFSLPSYRDRATFHTTMATSLVFDFRDGVSLPMSESAKEYLESSEDVQCLFQIMKNHPYHDFFEFDIDFIGGSSSLKPKELAVFLEGTKSLNLPVQYKCGFKLRKLGNYKAYGIYFSHSRMLGIDFREGKESYIHEMAHHIDLNKSFRGRPEVVKALRNHFSPKIDERREYYLKSEELIARAAEVAMLLKASKYRFLNDFRAKPEVMIVKMRENYALSKESRFMKSWLNYAGSIHHVGIESQVRNGDFKMLDRIDAYFSVFWGWDAPISPLQNREDSQGTSHYDKSPYSESHHSMNFYMADIYSFKYPEFDRDEYSDLVLNFLTSSMPISRRTSSMDEDTNTQPLFDPIENINTLKRLWAVYDKYKDPGYVRVALNKIPVLHLDEHTLSTVRNDFDVKFKESKNYKELKQSLISLIEILKGFGYE